MNASVQGMSIFMDANNRDVMTKMIQYRDSEESLWTSIMAPRDCDYAQLMLGLTIGCEVPENGSPARQFLSRMLDMKSKGGQKSRESEEVKDTLRNACIFSLIHRERMIPNSRSPCTSGTSLGDPTGSD